MTSTADRQSSLRVRALGVEADWLRGAIRAHEVAIVDGSNVLKNEHKTAITRISHEGRAAVVKHYRYMGARFLLKGVFRRHPARRSLDAARAMRERDIPTPRPLGLVERLAFGLTAEAWLVTEQLEGVVEMDRYVLRSFHPRADRRRRARFAYAFADALATLMRSGIHHRDLKLCNILVHAAGDDWRFAYIDLDDVDVRPEGHELTRDEWLLALAQLNPSTPKVFPRTDRLRFFERLAPRFGVLREWPRKDLIARVQDVSRRRRRAYFSDEGPVDVEFV